MTIRTAAYAAAARCADVLWRGYRAVDRFFPEGSFTPKWATGPLLKSRERSRPELGFPRQTDSLCPVCTKEVRQAILEGRADWRVLVEEKPGEIPAKIVERADGSVWMEKSCPKHGDFEDILSLDAAWLRRIESLYPGRDFVIPKDGLHDHGSSSIRYGRGAVLTVDLTNRCNMMCEPCFVDANQVGYVHELEWEEIRDILENAASIKPKRQMSVQFSGGEPTLSPHFIAAIRKTRELGFFSVQCASNGIRFAQEPEFAREAVEAGLRLVYLQFDGVGNENNQHRKVENLFDVKQRALENLKAAGADVTLVITIVNGVNDQQVGPIIRFAIQNIDKINALSFQPISFTGRDEDASEEQRRSQRYTLSHFTRDVKGQTGFTEPMRDWFPLSASGPFSDLKDLLGGGEAEWGSLKCGCHPNCGVGTLLLVNEKSGETAVVSAILNVDRFLADLAAVTDSARGKFLTALQTGLAVARNLRPENLPAGLGLWDVVKVMDGHTGRKLGIAKERRYEWRVLLVAGMWFQDLWNYDFRRTEMCIIPYGTQLGEISFCAYNTGVGWRQIIEEMFQTAKLAEWYRKNGRHQIWTGGTAIPLSLPTVAARRVQPEGTGLPASEGETIGVPTVAARALEPSKATP
jgi:uncharacterized radical SAM superfamily Fe-S cluster-containing enzyme